MTKDDIIKLAREAGFEKVIAIHPDGAKTVNVAPVPELLAFANLVAAAEPICPDCKAALLYECIGCSSNNYPPKQQAEPVAWVCINGEKHDIDFDQPEIDAIPVGTFLYTTPPQREWQGLTTEEVKHLYPYGRSVWGKETFEAIEKALKDKNT